MFLGLLTQSVELNTICTSSCLCVAGNIPSVSTNSMMHIYFLRELYRNEGKKMKAFHGDRITRTTGWECETRVDSQTLNRIDFRSDDFFSSISERCSLFSSSFFCLSKYSHQSRASIECEYAKIKTWNLLPCTKVRPVLTSTQIIDLGKVY